MKTKKNLTVYFLALLLLALASCNKKETFRYEENWESIRSNYSVPDWFRDAKFGIFLHWGVYSVPAAGAGYPSRMYHKGSPSYNHHIATYGEHKDFGYIDFVPMFKAEKFDANEWVKTFKKAGAKYVIPVAEHHDGYAMYNSQHTPWNSVKTGPKRDVLKEISDACKEENLKFGASSHLVGWRTSFRKTDEYGTNDPKNYDFYWKPEDKESSDHEFYDLWWNRTKDLIDNYDLDMIWFDYGLDYEAMIPIHKKLLAYFYNNALDRNKEVVFCNKNMCKTNWKDGVFTQDITVKSFPEDIIILDLERGRKDDMFKFPWITDTSMGEKSWSYREDEQYKTSDYIIDEFIDIVSKNGCYLLNIGPKADGTLPKRAINILTDIGNWLDVNGEAIYETRPWEIYGEGPTEIHCGNHTEWLNPPHVADDIRFTTKGDDLYATALGWNDDGQYLIKSLAQYNIYETRAIKSVEFISGDNQIVWEQTREGLKIKVSGDKPNPSAYVFKINF